MWTRDNRQFSRVPFREIDELLEQKAIERLTPINSREHHFRHLYPDVGVLKRSAPTISAKTNAANAGAADTQREIRHARRKVRNWPHVTDEKAPCVGNAAPYCPLVLKAK